MCDAGGNSTVCACVCVCVCVHAGEPRRASSCMYTCAQGPFHSFSRLQLHIRRAGKVVAHFPVFCRIARVCTVQDAHCLRVYHLEKFHLLQAAQTHTPALGPTARDARARCHGAQTAQTRESTEGNATGAGRKEHLEAKQHLLAIHVLEELHVAATRRSSGREIKTQVAGRDAGQFSSAQPSVCARGDSRHEVFGRTQAHSEVRRHLCGNPPSGRGA